MGQPCLHRGSLSRVVNRRERPPGGRAQLTIALPLETDPEEIDERELAVGEVLPSESDLARQFGVSKGSIREALRILEVNGFVSVKAGAGGGPVVSDPNASSGFARAATMFLQHGRAHVAELLTARVALEPVLAGMAASAGQSPARRRSASSRGGRTWTSRTTRVPRGGERFHHAVGGATGNQVLNLFGRGLIEVFHTRVPGSSVPVRRRRAILEAHERIGQAILAGDAAAASEGMREHVQAFARDVQQRHARLMTDPIEWT